MSSKNRNGLSCTEAGRLGYSRSKLALEELVAARRDKYEIAPKNCSHCGKHLPYEKRENKFCSRSCAATVNNMGVRRHGNPKSICKNCGSITAESSRQYCSNKCRKDYEWMMKRKEIEKNGEFKLSMSCWIPKRYLREKNGAKCSICGNTEWNGRPIPLVLDHIDGNHTNCKIENFRMICGNCDMQTETYKGKNKGNGRFYRTQRRLSGKSY